MSTDIYEIKDPPWMNKPAAPTSGRRSRRRRSKTFEEATNRDLSKTHRRRSRNQGFRRFRHLMKRPDFSRRFWVTSATVLIVALAVLLVWELFFHYPKPEPSYTDDVYEAVVE